MKHNAAHNLAIIAAIAAFLVMPVNALAVTIAFAVTGILAILFADYGQSIEPIRAQPRALPFTRLDRPSDDLRAAA